MKKEKMKRTIKTVALLLLATTAIFLWSDIKDAVASSSKKENTKSGKQEKKQTEITETASGSIVITKKWDLPKILTEISGLAYLDEDRFACVQDEQGTVFIYNYGRDSKQNLYKQQSINSINCFYTFSFYSL